MSPAADGVVIKAEGLHKEFVTGSRHLHILRGVDLEVARGEAVSIVGASGAGKTTLLHILGLLEPPTKGTIRLLGRDVTGVNGSTQSGLRNRTIGFVFQFYHLLGDLDAIENVLLPAMVGSTFTGWLRTRHEYREKARRLLEQVGLAERLHHRPSQLSGGERQRVAMARALMNDPEVLLLDEPTGNLDFETGREVMDLLWRIRDETRLTAVFVTHDDALAVRAGRKLRLVDGVLVKA